MVTALTRHPSKSLVNCEVSYIPREEIDISCAARQHDEYCRTLKHMGVEVETLPPEDHYPDSLFLEDNAIILDELAVVTSMGTESRREEPSLLIPILSRYRHIVEISSPAKIEGGDIFLIGKTLYVGLSSRTDQAGVEALRAIVEPFGYVVSPIDIQGCLHLKTACAPLDDETFLVNPSWINVEVLGSFRLLPVQASEPFGANVMRLERGILANAAYPLTIDMLQAEGYSVTGVDISEFSKLEAGPTCLSLLIENNPESSGAP